MQSGRTGGIRDGEERVGMVRPGFLVVFFRPACRFYSCPGGSEFTWSEREVDAGRPGRRFRAGRRTSEAGDFDSSHLDVPRLLQAG